MSEEKEISIGAGPQSPIKLDSKAKEVEQPKSQPTTAEELLSQIVSMQEDDFIPWEEFALPSKGVYYGGKIPGGLVMVRAMGVHADKILATQRLAQTGQSIDYLYKHCVKLPNDMDHAELLSGDRVYLLYLIRGITHGPNYEFIIKCQNCEMSSNHQYNLNELNATTIGPKEELGEEPFKIVLPYMTEKLGREVWVKIRFMRGKDISWIANRQRFNKKTHNNVKTRGSDRAIIIDQSITENINLIITSFGGAGVSGEMADHGKIKNLVDKMHARDTATIRQFLKDNSPGIDTTIAVQCPECGEEFTTELPITESFFRPTRDRETR